jgi:hypothetical protein
MVSFKKYLNQLCMDGAAKLLSISQCQMTVVYSETVLSAWSGSFPEQTWLKKCRFVFLRCRIVQCIFKTLFGSTPKTLFFSKKLSWPPLYYLWRRNSRHFGTGTNRHQDTSAPVWDISVPRQIGTQTIRQQVLPYTRPKYIGRWCLDDALRKPVPICDRSWNEAVLIVICWCAYSGEPVLMVLSS